MKANVTDAASFDFGSRLGKKHCYPIRLEEMWALPEMLGCRSWDFYAAGMNRFVDYQVIPASFLAGKGAQGSGKGDFGQLDGHGPGEVFSTSRGGGISNGGGG